MEVAAEHPRDHADPSNDSNITASGDGGHLASPNVAQGTGPPTIPTSRDENAESSSSQNVPDSGNHGASQRESGTSNTAPDPPPNHPNAGGNNNNANENNTRNTNNTNNRPGWYKFKAQFIQNINVPRHDKRDLSSDK